MIHCHLQFYVHELFAGFLRSCAQLTTIRTFCTTSQANLRRQVTSSLLFGVVENILFIYLFIYLFIIIFLFLLVAISSGELEIVIIIFF